MLNRKDFRFEICANGVESCIAAQEGGADRVELCAGIPEGGTTPSYGEIKLARKVLTSTLLHVIIRPRGGDFLYSELELQRMEEDIDIARELGADGVVFGCLQADGSIDMEANCRLMAHAKGLNTTFHRAFDRCNDPEKALQQLIGLGFNRVLTSGQRPTAAEGADLLRRLNKQAAGRITILAGCGVNEKNIKELHDKTGIHEFHFSARERRKSGMQYSNPEVYMGAKGADEESLDYTTAARVRKTIAALLD
ncbi:copper homeostasis protein CutC [Prevotella sp. KH2C16]|uniref:copper homeostasis protein CutC n=1 Tax=Prevotella sp. KH2C16 TaxID=1855325 RepID=UPI0008E48202|nr:copper homeostasis protein CutC [Prevotella sp. KH2C16]SFG51307.1 copper homeostasis protein [Prevotella sp. KH2C16]